MSDSSGRIAVERKIDSLRDELVAARESFEALEAELVIIEADLQDTRLKYHAALERIRKALDD
jgi:predicted  nucleic acid-binding Zn-ribbon protein